MTIAELSAAEAARPWMVRIESGPHSLARVARGDVHAFFVRAGRAVATTPDERLILGPDDLMLVGAASARTDLTVDAGADVWAFRLPAAPFAAVDGLGDGRVLVLSAARPGMATILGHVLRALTAEPDQARGAGPRLAAQLADLTATHGAEASRPTDDGVFAACEALIESALWDAELTPGYIAAHVHVSVRSLHRAFRERGMSVSAWIRTRRLEHCRLDLQDATLDDLSIRAIGSRWGLHDPAHLSRLFKDAYGTTPTAFRDERRRPAAS